jgi:hypothetical protein
MPVAAKKEWELEKEVGGQSEAQSELRGVKSAAAAMEAAVVSVKGAAAAAA